MTGESSNDAGGWMYRRKGEMTGACVVCDVVCMSRDITPIQSHVPVFVMTRLCANAEIGVPRGRIAMSPALFLYAPSSPHSPLSPHTSSFLPPSVIPASPRRHSCEGRNLNQGMDALTYTSP